MEIGDNCLDDYCYIVKYSDCYMIKCRRHSVFCYNDDRMFTNFEEAKESLIDYWYKMVQDSKIHLKEAKTIKCN